MEVHDKDELRRVSDFENAIIGVNNRNLKTFEVNLENSITLRKSFNKDNIFISESGIQSKADIEYLQRNKISYYLIGESLMRNVFN
jgi:indole-3-glycerol phosphate synthase